MNDSTIFFRLLLCAAGTAALALGCDSGGDGTTTGGGSGSGGATSTTDGGSTTGGVTIVPAEDGWVDMTSNTLGIQGAWYAYGDAYDEAKCINNGWTADQCSRIDTPDPLGMSFPNTGGAMCTSGEVAQVLTKEGETDPDYSNMWGAGIGLDLNNAGGEGAVKMEWDATAAGVTGVAFDIDMVAPLRVEFPMTATEGHVDGSNYWGASSSWPNSPIMAGHNELYWGAVHHPNDAVPLDPNNVKILGIQFHVPANTSSSTPYAFCISNLTFLTTPPPM